MRNLLRVISLLLLTAAPVLAQPVDVRNPLFNSPTNGIVIAPPDVTCTNLGPGTINACGSSAAVSINGNPVGGGVAIPTAQILGGTPSAYIPITVGTNLNLDPTSHILTATGGANLPTSAPLIGSNSGGSGVTITPANGLTISGGNLIPTFGTSVNTIAQGNDSRIVGALQSVPAPTTSVLGGLLASTVQSGQFVSFIDTSGVQHFATPAGGGNVSNTGTPVNGQIAQWVSSTVVGGVASTTFATTVNGVSCGLTGSCTVAAAAGTLTGSALPSGVTSAPGLTTAAGGAFGTGAFAATIAIPSASLLGGNGTALSSVTLGTNLSITNGVLNATGGGITIPTAPLLSGNGTTLGAVTAISGVPISGSTGAFTTLTAPVSGDLAGTLPSPTVNGMTGCGQCFVAGGSGNGNLAKVQFWAPDNLRAQIIPFSGNPDIAWELEPAGCGGMEVVSNTWGSALNVAAPHGCDPVTFTGGTISGTTFTFTGVTGSVSQGQILTGVGIAPNTFITGGSGTTWTVNNSQSVGPIAMSGAAVSSATLAIRPPNSNETNFQFNNSNGAASVFESGLISSGPNGLGITTTGGMVTILTPSSDPVYNFNLPTTAGTSGQVLTSGGGGSSPMTWTAAGAAAAGTLTGTTLASNVTASSLTSFGAAPALGTPASGVLTNATGLPLSSGVTGTLQAAQEPAHTGDVTNTAGSLATTVNGMTGCGQCFVAGGAGSGNLAKVQFWAPDNLRAKIFPFSGNPDIAWELQPAGCGGMLVVSDTWGVASQVAAPHGCDPVTFTGGTISGTTFTFTGVTGSVSQGQILTGVGIAPNTFITGGSGTTWTVNNSQSVGPIAMSGAAVAKAGMIERPPNSNEPAYQFSVSDGSAPIFEGGLIAFGANGLGITSVNGQVTILSPSGAPVYNFNLPTTAGTSGQVLTSGGGGSSPMTWTAAGNVAGNLTVSGKLIFTGASPTITGGTATLDATASNQAGTVTEGTAQTGFTLTFNAANPFTTTPHCVVSSPNGSALTSYTPSTTTLVVANLTATGSSFTYVCVQ